MLPSHDEPTPVFPFFFFNDTATTEIYTLSLHDALPIYFRPGGAGHRDRCPWGFAAVHGFGTRPVRGCSGQPAGGHLVRGDRKSTRLNSSHLVISYAVFCLKKNNIAFQHAQRRYTAADSA